MIRQTARDIYRSASGPLKFESKEAEERFYNQLDWPEEMFYMLEDNGCPVMRAPCEWTTIVWVEEIL